MKIDFIVTSLSAGGGEKVLTTIANNFISRKKNVSIITFSSKKEYEIDPKINRIKLHKRSGFLKNETLRYTKQLYKHYKNKNNRPDVIISFMTQTSLSAIIVARLFKIKIIASEHTNHLRTSTNRRLVNFTRKFIYKFADLVTILTSFDTNFYKKYGVNTQIVPNPCSFSSPNTSENFKKENVILAIGGLDKYHIKGFDNLLNLIKPVLDSNPEWVLKIVGGGNVGLKYLKDLAIKNNIESKVIFTGFSDKVSDIMRQSKIFVLSSRNEGLPMALIEAMSQGMACIAYDCITGPSDIIEHNVDGLLIKDQDIYEMQIGLNKLIKNTELSEQLGLNALKSVGKYNENTVCDLWEELIQKIL